MITNLTKVIENNNISVDSLQIRIPLILCDLEHTDLKDSKYIVSIDGEQVGTIEPNKHLSNYSGITVIYKIKNIPVWNTSTKRNYFQPCLCIGVSSKVLKFDYLEGITATNLENVYGYLDSLNVAKFDYSIFKGSLCTDIDYKLDFNISELGYNDFDKLTKDIELLAIPKGSRKLGPNRISKPKNKGIEFQTRKNTFKYVQNPFLKFYNKHLELASSKSIEFRNTHLPSSKIKDCRIETTVKNKKHLKNLGINDNSLSSLINLTKEQKENILLTAINKNLLGLEKKKKKKDLTKLTYFEKMYCLAISNPCMDLNELKKLYETTLSKKEERFKMRNKIEKLKEYC